MRTKKTLVRKQIMADILEINAEISGLREILRMKQCLLRKTNQDIYKMSKASSYIDLVPGKKGMMVKYTNSTAHKDGYSKIANLKLIEGGQP